MKKAGRFFGWLLFFVACFACAYYGARLVFRFEGVSKNVRITPEPLLSGSYYYQLNDSDKELYDALLGSVLDGGNGFDVASVRKSEMESRFLRIINAVEYDHPELFWLKSGYKASYARSLTDEISDVIVQVPCYDFWSYSSNPQRYYDRLTAKVEEISALANRCETDYEKARFVYEYIINNTEYDHERLAEAQKTDHASSCDLIYTAYGCLVEGRAVCAGYAKAFKLLRGRCGISCYYVVGEAGGGKHGWNCVELDGNYYFVDATWGDGTVFDTDGNPFQNCVDFEYFCMTDEDLSVTHETDESLLDCPECTAEYYVWFVYNGLERDSLTAEEAAEMIKKQGGYNPALIRLTSFEAFDEIYEDEARSKLKKDIVKLLGYGCAFSFKREKRLIMVYHQ